MVTGQRVSAFMVSLVVDGSGVAISRSPEIALPKKQDIDENYVRLAQALDLLMSA